MQSYLVEELNKAKARIKELEEKLELYMEAHGNMVVLNDSYAERGAQLKKEIGHLEAELKAVKYCAHCHEAQTDVCPAIKKDQGAGDKSPFPDDLLDMDADRQGASE